MKNSSRQLVLSCALILATIPGATAFSAGVTAFASVNGYDGPYTMTSGAAGASVSVLAEHGGSMALASANTDLIFKTLAVSDGLLGLVAPSDASAGMLKPIRISGLASGESAPLTFHFHATGTLQAKTPFSGVASVALRGLVQTVATRRSFFEQLTVKDGLPFSFSSNLSDARAKIGVSVGVRGGESRPLSNEQLKDFLLDPELFDGRVSDFDVSAYSAAAASIAQQIYEAGMQAFGLAEKTVVDVLMDTSFIYDQEFDVSGSFLRSDTLEVNLSADATAGPTGSYALADFSHTFTLDRITVPFDYTAHDPSTLRVSFDNGPTIQVTRDSAPVPEPVTVFGGLIGLALALAARRRPRCGRTA